MFSVSPPHLKLLLSFAVGGLLGDVFLHLLPESWMYLEKGKKLFLHLLPQSWMCLEKDKHLFLLWAYFCK